MITAISRWAALPLALFLCAPPPAPAQQVVSEYEGAAALGLELRRMGSAKRVLMIGAHPDDESTQILSTLALGEGTDVAYLALTRGEGGQNGIGPELEEGLGLLRTEELLAARRLDGARQFFTRAYDYGFSRNAEEAFQHWPREALLADVVAVVRQFRPDVILSIFSGTTRDGHGQHQAAGLLAHEAFDAAADPARFPGQIEAGLRPFAPSRLYLALWGDNDSADLWLETGRVDPLLGGSHFQVAMASRSRHRSQDMGRPLTPGPQASGLELVASRGPIPPQLESLFTGLDSTLSARVARAASTAGNGEENAMAAAAPLLRDYESRAEAIRLAFNPLAPDRLVPMLAEALRGLRRAVALLPSGELRDAAVAEGADAEAALWRASSLELDAVSDQETVIPGQQVELVVSLWNGGERAVAVRRLEPLLPTGWTASPAEPLPPTLDPGVLVERRFTVVAAHDAAPTSPYFLRREREGDLYVWEEGRQVGVPFDAAEVRAVAEVAVVGEPVSATVDGAYLALDRRQGELRRPVRVVPAISLLVDPPSAVVPLRASSERGGPLPVSVRVRSEAPSGAAGTLELAVPTGWRAEPASAPLTFAAAGEERTVGFTLVPPSRPAAGRVEVAARFVTDDGETFGNGATLVDYPHVLPHPIYRDARLALHTFDIAVPEGLRVGYIPGAGDDAPAALRQLGVDVTVLQGPALATADLRQFDALLTGIRAYEVNADLVAQNSRLLDYARRGGTLIVQYSKYEYTEPGIAPYQVAMARPHGRVTNENAPVRLLHPDHQALSWPNRITSTDFEGWQQERGLYFLSEWDDRFTPLLEMADPGEDAERGSLLIAPLGEGTYVYTGIAFFRQLPEGVPGAHRLLVNLLSLGKTP
jgi:LmbE family N-acetylglucosaminyl deacetylase